MVSEKFSIPVNLGMIVIGETCKRFREFKSEYFNKILFLDNGVFNKKELEEFILSINIVCIVVSDADNDENYFFLNKIYNLIENDSSKVSILFINKFHEVCKSFNAFSTFNIDTDSDTVFKFIEKFSINKGGFINLDFPDYKYIFEGYENEFYFFSDEIVYADDSTIKESINKLDLELNGKYFDKSVEYKILLKTFYNPKTKYSPVSMCQTLVGGIRNTTSKKCDDCMIEGIDLENINDFEYCCMIVKEKKV